MKKLLSILFCLLFASGAWAGDDCAMDMGSDTVSPLQSKYGAFETLKKPTLDLKNRALHHAIKLPSGVVVAYTVGGCAHYSYRYTFSHLADMPAGKGKALFDYVRAQAKLLPVDAQEHTNLNESIAKLEKAAPKPEHWSHGNDLEISGDETNELELTKDGFALSYDFPL